MNHFIRLATPDDISAIAALIPVSAYALQANHYSKELIEAALGPVFAVDELLVEDQTYFVAVADGEIVGCGGWSKRDRPYGGNQGSGRLLDPSNESASIRAFFDHPNFARRGIGSAIMNASERDAKAAGFNSLTLVATLTGELLYSRFGFDVVERIEIKASKGFTMPVVRMSKQL